MGKFLQFFFASSPSPMGTEIKANGYQEETTKKGGRERDPIAWTPCMRKHGSVPFLHIHCHILFIPTVWSNIRAVWFFCGFFIFL